MAVVDEKTAGGKNIIAFLDMLAVSELGEKILAESDNGYDVIVGSVPGKLILMNNYLDHPKKLVKINARLSSTAAGRYQLLARYFGHYKLLLKLKDFGPLSQDLIAIRMIKEQGAFKLIQAGDISGAIKKTNNIWASLTGAGYNQNEHSEEFLIAAYKKAGGVVA